MYTGIILGVMAVTALVGYFAANVAPPKFQHEDEHVVVDARNFSFLLQDVQPLQRSKYELKILPTAGEAWPKPRIETKLNYFYTASSNSSIKITNHNCKILVAAVNRYASDLKNMYHLSQLKLKKETGPWELPPEAEYRGLFLNFNINLTSPCERVPYPDMDESYKCMVLVNNEELWDYSIHENEQLSLWEQLKKNLLFHTFWSNKLTITSNSMLVSNSIWGMLRGLETAIQLFYFNVDGSEIRINATSLIDYPEYSHRGFMLDTSRHYIPVEMILKNLDAMAMNKMNIFHWHLTDDEGFSFQSQKFPELSEKGAILPSMVYSKDHIIKVIEYARMRGIIVYPEINIPGNAASWGRSHPELILECVPESDASTSLLSLNFLISPTYKLLWQLFKELAEVFPYDYFHIGGGQIDVDCLASIKAVKAMVSSGASVHELLHAFTERIFGFLRKANAKTPIVFQDLYDIGLELPANVIVQVYKDEWVRKTADLVNSGRRVIVSSPWDLEGTSYLAEKEKSFVAFYRQQPRRMVRNALGNAANLKVILGGEVYMWTFATGADNVIPRAWPLAAAAAEVLWSTRVDEDRPTEYTLRRAKEHTRRMRRRGINVGELV